MRKSTGVVQLGEEKALGRLSEHFQYSIRAYKHFSMACCNSIRDGFKLKEGRFRYEEKTSYEEGCPERE